MGPTTKEARDRFMEKYPDADMSKFHFDTVTLNSDGDTDTEVYFITQDEDINITSKEFLDNSDYTKYLTVTKPIPFPKIWLSNGSIQDLPKGHVHYIRGYDGKVVGKFYDGYPSELVLDYPINNFRVYVNGSDYFMSKLPIISINTWDGKSSWDDGDMYYMVLFSIYCASYCCGVGMQHLTPKDDIYPMITSIMRFHLYFTVRRLITRMTGGESMSAISREFNADRIYKQIKKVPRNSHYQGYVLKDGSTGEKLVYTLHNVRTDYKRYIPKISNGFTEIGLQYLNQSIESYVYSVLGSQAKTRVSIVSSAAGKLETQAVFRQLVGDSIINYDISTWILNMNKSIGDTNVIQNLAISPSLWLVPSRMVILKNPIYGYNNLLKTASGKMVFGVNHNLNYFPTRSATPANDEPKKVHDSSGFHQARSGLKPAIHKQSQFRPNPIDKASASVATIPEPGLPVLLGGSVICGFIVSRYVL